MKPIIIIAEAGVNHNGSLSTALKMVRVAKQCGADAIKFQTFNAQKLVSRFAPKAEYQKENTSRNETQLSMLTKLALSGDDFNKIVAQCKKVKIQFLSSPFDLESIGQLAALGVEKIKIPSGELTNLPYLEKLGALNKKILLSTGMATLREVKAAIKILVDSGTAHEKITLLHCTTEYPAPFDEVNLNAIKTLRKACGLPVGYSDHTTGIEVSVAAAALGSTVLEKHFTLDKTQPGPDHKASVEPGELALLIRSVRNVERAMGNGIKEPLRSEQKNRAIARKSIVASRAILKGSAFSKENITVKRPGTGISPMKWHSVLSKRAKKDFNPDELIEL